MFDHAAPPRRRKPAGGLPWTDWLQALVLIRLGQELGTDSQMSRSIATAIDAVVGVLTKVLG